MFKSPLQDTSMCRKPFFQPLVCLSLPHLPKAMLFKLSVAISIALFAVASPLREQNVEKRVKASVYTKCTVPNTAALTFDDGPYDYIYDISNILKQNGATATFFFNGNNYHCIYDQESASRVKFVYDQGHHVASHTWGHKDLSTLNWDQIHSEMWMIEQALMRITGSYPAFMRPPYGKYNDTVLEASGIRGQEVVMWDFDSGDSAGVSSQDSRNRYLNIANAHPDTLLAVNHETRASAVYEVLPYAIQQLKAKGYQLVSVAECLGKPKYQWIGVPQQRTVEWHC
ncbi:carbohydrate esterase family 4 protein [Crepidotus variabilis]|uniref:Carbohydrate esterase family 4 protein n=1 Tax=Crepidotus variabilis TaxID=179855 RepID=A0A9P6EL21_9AGAR|nr:carbohydrate esterase family 4 protein [Crepidotus variabilis]